MATTDTARLPGLDGVRDGIWYKGKMDEGMIIGVVDDGIGAGELSFSADGIPPPPAKWKGKCAMCLYRSVQQQANRGERASYFVAGAGEVNLVKAMDRGLVYNLTADDFIPYLCSMKIADDRFWKISEPAMVFMDENAQQVDAKRTVMNVGRPRRRTVRKAPRRAST
ncbi:hypothetical protein E2562_028634 [Oryza meyeriana var. granulata]|uniref:Peptidase S8/S53 domain-containing protein n=1 Tax=Oryza meyeriana var. granulata TaxID=110450 RepID=A0A6G1FD46_9ORYZ|nr:hypothetical protein E2562_028634 [Oryza meyeriana var. granulata]